MDDVQQVLAPLHVRDQQLDGRVRAQRPELPETGGELTRALVGEVVPRDGGDDGVAELQRVDGPGDVLRLQRVHGVGEIGRAHV